MSRRMTAWAASCAAVLVMLSGCQFFGIDTRPDIRYVTEKERKNVAEPMYSMPVAGTGLFKQWPMRLGPDYGYAPWEKKKAGAMAANGPMAPGAALNSTAAAQTPPAKESAAALPATTQAAAAPTTAPNKAIALAESARAAANKPAGAKPSHRATPRMASGDLAENATTTDSATETWNATRGAAQPRTIAVTDDLDVPDAARGDLDFRAPSGVATTQTEPHAAAAVVARGGGSVRASRPPVEEDLAWGSRNEEGLVESEAIAGDVTAAPEYEHSVTTASSTVGLQQPGMFSARKAVVAKPRPRPQRAATGNVLRDEAVRPASATLPLATPKSAPRSGSPYESPFHAAPGASVDEELIPPGEEDLSDDPLSQLPVGMIDVEASRTSPQGPTQRSAPRLIAPPTMMDDASGGRPRVGTFEPARDSKRVIGRIAEDSGEPVFVTASDMSDELPYADAAAERLRSHLVVPPQTNAEPRRRAVTTNATPHEYVNPHYYSEPTGDGSDVNDAFEAAKRAVLQ